MTTPWNLVTSTGRGTLAYRVRIEGLPTDFVTHPDMTKDASSVTDRNRRLGLIIKGAKISQRVDIPRSEIDASGFEFSIADVGGAATDLFSNTDYNETFLSETELTSADTTAMDVLSNTAFSTSGYLWLDSECVYYTGKSGDTQFTGLTRGLFDTLAQYHYSAGLASSGGELRYVSITDKCPTVSGRRVFLYAYARGDDLQGDGTQVWIGTLIGDPSLRGPLWSFSADPISRILDQDVGGDLGETLYPRGIYFPGQTGTPDFKALYLSVYRRAYASGGSTILPFAGGSTAAEFAGRVYFPHPVYGQFFETQQDFVDAVQAQLDDLQSGWGTTVYCKLNTETGGYYFEYQCSGSPDGIVIRNDGGDGRAAASSMETDPEFNLVVDVDGTVMSSVSANGVYYQYNNGSDPDDAGACPRGTFVQNTRGTGNKFSGDTGRKIYLGGTVVPTGDIGSVQIKWNDGTGITHEYEVTDTDVTDRFIVLGPSPAEPGSPPKAHYYRSSNLPEIKLGRSYRLSGIPLSGLGTYELMKSLENNCAQYANLGVMPIIRSSDWTTEDTGWRARYVNPDTGLPQPGVSPLALKRRYTSFKSEKLKDLLVPDLQLAGMYLCFDETGRLDVQRIKAAVVSETPVLRITRHNLVGDMPSFQKTAFGNLNTFVLQEGYDPVEDKWTGQPISVRNVTAFGRDPIAKTISVKPKSIYGGSPDDLVKSVVEGAAAPVLTVYGSPYAIVDLAVSMVGFNASLGKVVSITTDLLPDLQGGRGMSSVKGIVTSREIELDTGVISMSILVSLANYAGYALDARVSSQTNISGDTWDLTMQSDYFASTETAADHIAAGDSVYGYQFDSEDTGTVSGTVVSVTNNTVRVTWSSAWTVGSHSWVLVFTEADSGSVTDNMRQYGYIAGSNARVDFDPPPTRSAFRMSP